MVLAQGRYWRAALTKDSAHVAVNVLKTSLSGDLAELKDLTIEIPLERWNAVVKNVRTDRKLLGGLLLAFATASHKDRVSTLVNRDSLLAELQRIVLDATASLVEAGILVLTAPKTGDS